MEMKIYFLFIVFAFQIVSSFDPENKHCLIRRCARGSHTMCLFSKNKSHNRCDRIVRAGLTDNEEYWILFLHNYYRTLVFNGHEMRGRPGPQPAAARVVALEWDNNLAVYAQRWANQCMTFNDICRNNDEYLVGQNYIVDDYDEDMDEDTQLIHVQELIETWYQEVIRFNSNIIPTFRRAVAFNTQTFNYTQLVWGNTTKIGCGAIRYHRVMFPVPKLFLVCNYGPSGNCEDQPVYEIRR